MDEVSKSFDWTRRDLLRTAGAALGVGAGATPVLGAQRTARKSAAHKGFRYCLNTATIMGQKVPLAETVALTAAAGYDAIEPWIREIEAYEKAGGSLPDLRKRIEDHGLKVESAIGFFEWIVDDDARRAKALDDARRAMDRVRQIGGTRLAAPPTGATDRSDIPLAKMAERYRALLDLGQEMGVVPQAEIWGFSKSLNRLGDASLVAIETGHPQACILADVYHLYKGGSGFHGMRLLSGQAMQVFHVNDYPANQPRETITDAHRVYPGDGIAPLDEVFRTLREVGFNGVLSLELFNRDYWQQDPKRVARTGLDKLKAAVAKALA